MIKEPMYKSPSTANTYDRQLYENAKARGWNEAMDFIFQEEAIKNKRIEHCWVHKFNGNVQCPFCQNRTRCRIWEAEHGVHQEGCGSESDTDSE